MNNYAIRAEKLGKRYRIVRGRRRVMLRDALEEAITSGWDSLRSKSGSAAKTGRDTFWALQDISFEIQPGESVGIIGSNGAGKSTLLKILSRVTSPSTGRAHLRGRVGSLLEVGTGFHAELTGRENVYLNGAVLGMRKREIDRKFDEIAAFSEVEEFLDTPVKFYSSGMRMRLAFSVAAHLEPEILLIDEVLSVGDAAFQRKSLTKMGDVVGHGRTVLFVSHNMPAVRALCQSAIYIDHGRIEYSGDVHSTIEQYLNQEQDRIVKPIEFAPDPSMRVQILTVSLEDEAGNLLTSVPHDRPFWTRLKVIVRSPVFQSHLAVHILESDMSTVLTVRDIDQGQPSLTSQTPGVYTYRVGFPAPSLVPGKYWLKVEVNHRTRWKSSRVIDQANGIWPFEIFDNESMLARMNVAWSGKIIVPAEWHVLEKETLRGG